MKNFYVTFDRNFFFQRIQLKDQFVGNARAHDFNGHRGMEINPDAYQILDLLDRQFSVTECIEQLAEKYRVDKKSLEPVVEQVIQSVLQIRLAEVSSTKPNGKAAKRVIPGCIHPDLTSPLDETFIELLSTCNLRCKHCYGSFGPGCSDVLGTETVFSLLDQLKDLQCPEVKFTGGEPFLHDGFMDILEYAHRHNFVITVLTNGTLLNSRAVNKMRAMGQMFFHVSIDGHRADIHDNFRGIKGAFNRSLRAVKLLRNAGFKVKIIHTLHKANREFVDEMWEMAEQLNVPVSVNQVYRFGSCVENVDDVFVEPADYFDVFKKLRDRSSAKGKSMLSFGNNGNKGEISVDYIERCEAGRCKCAVRPNGDMTPCISLPHIEKFVMGNIYKSSITDIFSSFDRQKMLGDVNALNVKKCKNCEIVAECKGGCVAVAYAETGKLSEYDPFSCVREKALRM